MRRTLVALLAIFYLAISGGVTMHEHYCMGQLRGASLWHEGDDHHDVCTDCGMEKGSGNGCCKDEHKTLKLEQKHVPGSDVALPFFAGFLALPAAQYSWEISRPFATQVGHYTAACNGPPVLRSSGTPIYLRVRNFRV